MTGIKLQPRTWIFQNQYLKNSANWIIYLCRNSRIDALKRSAIRAPKEILLFAFKQSVRIALFPSRLRYRVYKKSIQFIFRVRGIGYSIILQMLKFSFVVFSELIKLLSVKCRRLLESFVGVFFFRCTWRKMRRTCAFLFASLRLFKYSNKYFTNWLNFIIRFLNVIYCSTSAFKQRHC